MSVPLGESEINEIFRHLAQEFYPDRKLGFRVEWSRRMTRSAGLCYYRRKVVRLSAKYHAAFPGEIANTLKHELIHAAGILGHGRRFREEAARLCCDVHAHPMPRRPFRYLYACPACGGEVRTRKRVDYSCGRCAKRWDPRFRLVLKRELQARA